jgi:WS/DGAT/MGAT family acyltransferase
MADVQYRSMMSSSDAIIWNIERDPQLQSTVMSVWLLDSVPTAERMAANVTRMVDAIPRLRQVAVDGRPRPSWAEVDHLDLEVHHSVESLPAGSDFDDVLACAQEWVREPFDRSRPLWRLGILTGLPDGKAAAVIKVHHAIADGMGMVRMLAAFTDLEANPPSRPAATSVRPEDDEVRHAFTPARRAVFKLRRGTRTFVRNPVGAIVDTGRTLVSASKLVMPHRTPLSPLMTARSGRLCMETRTVPLPAFKAFAKANAATLNDTFVAVVADALDRYHARHGASCERLRVHMPVDIRNSRTTALAGNQFVPARVSLDLGGHGLRARLASVRVQLAELREEPALHHINTVSAAIQRLGKPISRWIIGGMMKGIDVLASNVPGPPCPLYLAGARIEEFYAFGPPAGAALNITLFSYDGSVNLGITTDEAALTERQQFLECLDESLAEVEGTVDRHVDDLAVAV